MGGRGFSSTLPFGVCELEVCEGLASGQGPTPAPHPPYSVNNSFVFLGLR